MGPRPVLIKSTLRLLPAQPTNLLFLESYFSDESLDQPRRKRRLLRRNRRRLALDRFTGAQRLPKLFLTLERELVTPDMPPERVTDLAA
jgi:hypothetical protein